MRHSFEGRLSWKSEKDHIQVLKSRNFPAYSEKKQQNLVYPRDPKNFSRLTNHQTGMAFCSIVWTSFNSEYLFKDLEIHQLKVKISFS